MSLISLDIKNSYNCTWKHIIILKLSTILCHGNLLNCILLVKIKKIYSSNILCYGQSVKTAICNYTFITILYIYYIICV